jgi:predicted ATPase
MGAPDPPPQMVDAIFHETNGNAFFVQSVFRHLSDEDQLFDSEGQWLSGLDTESLAVPDSVRLVTSRRIAKLSQPTQDLLAIAAVLGLRFRLSVLEAAAPERESMVDSIEEADAAQLIRQSIGGRNLRYEFVHALARQTLLSSLSAPRQQQLHLKIAEAIQASYRKNPDRRAADLAYHLVEAGNLADPKQVIHWSAVAGNNAMKTAAFEEAAHYFSTAIAELGDEMVNEGADEAKEQKADLLHTRGAAQLSKRPVLPRIFPISMSGMVSLTGYTTRLPARCNCSVMKKHRGAASYSLHMAWLTPWAGSRRMRNAHTMQQ